MGTGARFKSVVVVVCWLLGAGIALWLCVGLAVLLDAVSWVRSSSEIFFSGRGDLSLGVNMGSDCTPPKSFG